MNQRVTIRIQRWKKSLYKAFKKDINVGYSNVGYSTQYYLGGYFMKKQLFVNALIFALSAGPAQASSPYAAQPTTPQATTSSLANNSLNELNARTIECQDTIQALVNYFDTLQDFKSTVKITDNSFEASRKAIKIGGSTQESHIKLFHSIINDETNNKEETLYAGQVAISDTTLHQLHQAMEIPAPIALHAKSEIVPEKTISLEPVFTPTLQPVLTPVLTPIFQPQFVPQEPIKLEPVFTPIFTPTLQPILEPTILPTQSEAIADTTPEEIQPQQQENIIKRAAKEAARRIVHNSSRAANFVKDQVINHPVRTGLAIATVTLAAADWFYGGTLSQGAVEYAQSFFSSNNNQETSPADNLDESEVPGFSENPNFYMSPADNLDESEVPGFSENPNFYTSEAPLTSTAYCEKVYNDDCSATTYCSIDPNLDNQSVTVDTNNLPYYIVNNINSIICS